MAAIKRLLETQAELEVIYADKMAQWSDGRLRHERGYVEQRDAEGNPCWGSKEVMAAWNKCIAAEIERRGLTF